MLQKQEQLIISQFQNLYNVVVPNDNMLRRINDLIDFGFVEEELQKNYCLENGRNAIPPVRMFKYLLLKVIFELSDVDVVERSKYDMSFKYFLGITPEADVINASSLTKFRKQRLKDINLLDLLISKTVKIAISEGVINSSAIIVDSTHTKARYNQRTPREALINLSKKVRKSVYAVDESMKEQMPSKPNTGILEDEIEYCKDLIQIVKAKEQLCSLPKIKEPLNLLEETVQDDIEKLQLSVDEDAKVGHKTYDTSFFGYKTHIAMSEERIITAAVVTSGEKHDGKQLRELVEKSKEAGIEVSEIIGDAAYSEKENLLYAKDKELSLISKLSKTITHGPRRKKSRI